MAGISTGSLRARAYWVDSMRWDTEASQCRRANKYLRFEADRSPRSDLARSITPKSAVGGSAVPRFSFISGKNPSCRLLTGYEHSFPTCTSFG